MENIIKEARGETSKLKIELREKNDAIDDLLQSKTFSNMERSQLEIDYSQLLINMNELKSENSDLKLKMGSLEKDLNRYRLHTRDANKVNFVN